MQPLSRASVSLSVLTVCVVAQAALSAPRVPDRSIVPSPARTPAGAFTSVKRLPVTAPLAAASGEVLVGVTSAGAFAGMRTGELRAHAPGLAAVYARHGFDRFERLSGGVSSSMQFYRLRSIDPLMDPVAAAADLRATGAFGVVCPNYRLELHVTLPNDVYLTSQWSIDDGGFADIRLPAAWDVEQGDTSVVIGIMDTGIDVSHPDMAPQIWRHPTELANGLDDDGNGLVDDLNGWDWGTHDNDPSPERTFDPSGIDVGFHGTFAAGIASAATNNVTGIAGAGWKCRLMPLKVSHPDSGTGLSAVTEAFGYAADQGVDVLSMSFGANNDSLNMIAPFFQALVDMATSAGVMCIASAGNAGDSTRVYPAANDNVVAVGATDLFNERAPFSNWGSWVDVAAPGALMWSTICQNYVFDPLDEFFYILLFGWDGINPYMFGDGTSFSCPLAAGVCALIKSRHPWMEPAQIADHLVTTGDVVAYDLPVGRKVNAFSAVNLAPVSVDGQARPAGFAIGALTPNPFTRSTAVSFALPHPGHVRLDVFDAQGRHVRALARGLLAAGTHTRTWNGLDDSGHALHSGLYFARVQFEGRSAAKRVVLIDR